MPAGIYIVNNGGGIQITDEMACVCLRRAGWVSEGNFRHIDQGPDYQHTKFVIIDLGAMNNPMLFLHASNDNSRCAGYIAREPNGNWYLYIGVWWNLTVVGNIHWWVFDNWIPPRQNAGMEIFGPDGSLKYHTAMWPLRVAGAPVIPGSQPPMSMNDPNAWFDGGWYGGIPAFGATVARSQLYIGGTIAAPTFIGGYFNGGQLRLSQINIDIGDNWKVDPAGLYRQNYDVPMIVADMSGYPQSM